MLLGTRFFPNIERGGDQAIVKPLNISRAEEKFFGQFKFSDIKSISHTQFIVNWHNLAPIYLENTLLKPRFKNTLSIY